MRILVPYLRAQWRLALLALILTTINQVFSLLDPLIFRHIIDDYAAQFTGMTTSAFFHGVGLLLLASMGVAFVSRVAKNFQDFYVNVIIQKMGARIYADGLAHSLELPYSVFEDQRSGETLGILQKARADLEKLIGVFVNVVLTSIIGVIFVAVYAARVHWAVAPAFFATVPILVFMSSGMGKRLKKVSADILRQTTALAGSTTESLRNIELIKSLGLATQEILRLNGTTAKILALELKKVKYIRSLMFVQGTLVNALRTSILMLMLYLIFARQITVGQFFSLWIYSFFIFGPLQELGSVMNSYREAQASLNNFAAILAMPKEPRPAHPVRVGPLRELEFAGVGFRHAAAGVNALQDVSFRARAGETIAFVGPSGAGKTTLVKLLVGLYATKEGRILYNGQDAATVDLDDLRARIGLVTQDTQLFSGTIRENLLFVNPSATDADCLDALQKAACQGLLARADQGLGTVIGEGGVKVSGGERQRLSIARALLRKPSLLVFDEATSSLDSLTEDEITTTIRSVSRGSDLITILIAHRLSTVLHADRIFVLEHGSVAESGRHADLVAAKGLYYAMWRQQIGEGGAGSAMRTKAAAVPV
jgi:ATP-binding cassette subfamily B protein